MFFYINLRTLPFNILLILGEKTKPKTFCYSFPPGTSQQESQKNSYAGTVSQKYLREMEERGEI